jgi:1-acyl-sn-glycerol-3-phosphate acyltransferase
MNKIKTIVLDTNQLFIYPGLLILRFCIVRNNLYRKELNLNKYPKNTSFILYANHQSMLDPFIIAGCMPAKTIKYLIPYRFFVENLYFNDVSKYFLRLLGGFPAHFAENKPHGINKAKNVLASKHTVVIFPSGKRTRVKTAKPGISLLAKEKNTYLVPINVDWKNRWNCHVYIGSPIKANSKLRPEQLMKFVYDLAV